eukprot:2637046-Prymnesium_polylepis.2
MPMQAAPRDPVSVALNAPTPTCPLHVPTPMAMRANVRVEGLACCRHFSSVWHMSCEAVSA